MHTRRLHDVVRHAATPALLALIAAVMMLSGCATTPRDDAPVGEAISYASVRARYNVRADRVKQMWVRSVVEVRWKDDDGKHFEQGDGPLILRKPDDVALSVGKLGNTMLWLGADAQRFWLFNLNPPKGEAKTAYVGYHADVGKHGMNRLPIPVRPNQLIDLLGITALPDGPAVARRTTSGDVTVTVQQSGAGGTYEQVYVLDAETMMPKAISFRSGGEVYVTANLTNYKPLRISEVAPGSWPLVPGRIEINAPKENATMTLFLTDPIDGAERIRDTQFDFERLAKALKPAKIVELKPN
ncbi:MAG: hypothetical protein GC159_13315 [Phycisphaera sp.]|nr:hypothetical protein [Phycisphaera sp.]